MKENKKDNSNPKANIAILCGYKFFFYAFLSTYQALSKIANVEFVLDFSTAPKGFVFPDTYKDSLRLLLKKNGVFFRDIDASTLTPEEFFGKYAMLISSGYIGYMNHPCNRSKKKVKIMYGPAKDGWAHGLQNAYFDLILCPGEYTKEKLSKFYSAEIVAVGEPKLDAYYSDTFCSENMVQLKASLDKSKKTILYIPTWGVLSSAKYIMPTLSSLLSEYNVVVKVHHMTSLFSKSEENILNDSRFIVADEDFFVTDLLKVSDIVISDSSSSIFDAMLTGKGVVLVDTLGDRGQLLLETAPFFSNQINGDLAGVPTSADSIEQYIKRNNVAPVVSCHDPHPVVSQEKLLEVVEKCCDQKYLSRQKDLIRQLYSYVDNNAGNRAAQAIVDYFFNGNERDRTLERYIEEYLKFKGRAPQDIIQEQRNLENIKMMLQNIKQMSFREKINILQNIFFNES